MNWAQIGGNKEALLDRWQVIRSETLGEKEYEPWCLCYSGDSFLCILNMLIYQRNNLNILQMNFNSFL